MLFADKKRCTALALAAVVMFTVLSALMPATASAVSGTVTVTASSGYIIDTDGYIQRVPEKVTLSLFLTNFQNSANIKVFEADGLTEVTSSSALIGTGMLVRYYVSGVAADTVTVFVLGDMNGNGKVDSNDALQVKSVILGKATYTGAYLKAADINGNGGIDSNDFLQIKSHILGKTNLYSSFPDVGKDGSDIDASWLG